MRAQGWYLDPYGRHGARWFSDGRPTKLVRDDGIESADEPPPQAPPTPLIPVTAVQVSDSSDMKRADEVTRKDQSFDPKEGILAALDGSGELGVGFS